MHIQEGVVGLEIGLVAAIVWAVARHSPIGRRVPLGAVLVVAWLVALAVDGPSALGLEPAWLRAVAVAAALALAGALHAADRSDISPILPTLLLVTLGGAWLTTPDTEVLVLLGAATAPLAALSLRNTGPFLGVGAAPLAGVFVWAAAYEARGRPASFVVALACCGYIAAAPLLPRRRRLTPVAVAVSHAAFVVVAARWAGPDRGLAPVAVKLALLGAVGGAVAMVASRRS